jgi:flagellar protein FlbD
MIRWRFVLIPLTSLDGKQFIVNSELIVTIHENANTIVILANGDHLVVKENSQQIINLVIAFRRAIFEGANLIIRAEAE